VVSRDRRATLANVAESAGVSVATVSKVLNGRNDVAPATRALVQDLLHEHEYVARRVKPAMPPAIELFFHGQLNAYHTEVLQGVVEAAREAGVAVVVSVRPREQ
jgi:LacI family transcriptional regulator